MDQIISNGWESDWIYARTTLVQPFNFLYVRPIDTNIVTDLINALPGNSSVNTVQHATIEEAVFTVSAVTSHNSR
jgi:hypothetical protein